MKKFNLPSSVTSFIIFILFAGVLTSCIDRSTSGEEEERIVTQFTLVELGPDTVTFRQNPQGTSSGSLSIMNSETSRFLIYFIDENSRAFSPETDKHALNFDVQNGADLISLEQITPGSQEYRFSITGKNTGEAIFRLQLLHEGEVEFQSVDIPVNVSEAN